MTVTLFYSGGLTNSFGITSIGGVKSTTPIPNGDLNNLWDDVNRVEVINGRIEHRCFYITNDGATDYLKGGLITLVIPANTEIAFELTTALLVLTAAVTVPISPPATASS